MNDTKTSSSQSVIHRDTLQFTVDAALLRELGERLVGKAHIALAELVKNSYDADATEVVILFGSDRIVISDNGHGMNFDEFKKYWMRIGSPHKQTTMYSRKFHRPVTGSKGVGRLSVQFLASQMTLVTASDEPKEPELEVVVNWRDAISAIDLTHAEAICTRRNRQQNFPLGTSHGTQITLTGLAEDWDADRLKDLAREIWALQPPFAENLADDDPHRFRISINSADEQIIAPAQQQLRAHLDIWEARLIGRLPSMAKTRKDAAPASLQLEFADGERVNAKYSLINGDYGSTLRTLDSAEFEIRIFKLEHKQRFGVRVGEAREYLNKFGGVHIYDAGFHLPYYGADTDWLRVEIDHSHRLSNSALLPEALRQPKGMNNLPTNSRIFGVVRVNTSHERDVAEQRGESSEFTNHLKNSVTRDRLIENIAYANLRVFVRWALDFYAMEETKRKLRDLEITRPIERAGDKIVRVSKILDDYSDQIPKVVLARIKTEIDELQEATDKETQTREAQLGLLGALATAGMAALAFEHEFRRQLAELKEISDELKVVAKGASTGVKSAQLAHRLEVWIGQLEGTRRSFSPLINEEDRTKRVRLKAKVIVEQAVRQSELFLRGIPVDIDSVDSELRLPAATLAEWIAIFQNVFTNAVNAMLDSRTKRIKVISQKHGRIFELLVLDTGRGVNLKTAETLFDPFVRQSKTSTDRARLAFGGTGLGLTIVKMIADSIGCDVDFVTPEYRYSTAFRISWSERK